MSHDAAARRYANALFELGKEQGDLAALVGQMRQLGDVIEESDELVRVLENPLVDEASREAVLREIAQRLGASTTVLNALRLLARRRRIGAVPAIARELDALVDRDAHIVRAEVASAAPLPQAYLDRLQAELERATGRKVIVTHSVDPNLVAGVVTRIGDRVIDGSARARLTSFRDALLSS